LAKNCDLEISKYKLWKTLHELGFRYKKLSGNRKCLVERTNIVHQRINYLRTKKKKREEGFIPVYLDETWSVYIIMSFDFPFIRLFGVR
jgi:hypothetical protein